MYLFIVYNTSLTFTFPSLFTSPFWYSTFDVILQLALKFVPSVVVAVILHVPFPTGVTFPSLLTIATFVLLLVHVNFFDALLGVITGFIFIVSALLNV